MILKILLENLDFSIEKIDFSIEKIEIFVFSPKINILFSIFFEIEIFKIIFLQEKKKFFDQFFFLPQVMWGLQGFMRSEVWESARRAAPPILFKFVQLRPFFWKTFHMCI